MRTSTIVWPEATLGCPLRSSWAATVKQRFASASLNPTITTYDENQAEERRIHECGFIWTRDQLAAFEQFHDVTLAAGMRWFMMDFLVAGLMVPTFSHIVGGFRLGDAEGYVTANMVVHSYRRRGRETT
jgi:hypothetical protein